MGERFRHIYPDYMDNTESIAVVSMRDAIVGNIGKTLYVLGAVALVLLIACVNVANLLLARCGGRHRELAIRAALGASRWRVIRPLLTENVLLATVGGFLGLTLGVLGVRMLLLLIRATSRASIRLSSETHSSSSTGEFLSSPLASPFSPASCLASSERFRLRSLTSLRP